MARPLLPACSSFFLIRLPPPCASSSPPPSQVLFENGRELRLSEAIGRLIQALRDSRLRPSRHSSERPAADGADSVGLSSSTAEGSGGRQLHHRVGGGRARAQEEVVGRCRASSAAAGSAARRSRGSGGHEEAGEGGGGRCAGRDEHEWGVQSVGPKRVC